MIKLLQIAEQVNLDVKIQAGMKDEASIIVIGASEEETEATPLPMEDAVVGVAAVTYTVPVGKKLIPLKLWVNKMSFTTDKKVIVSVTETTTAKIDLEMIVGQTVREEIYPFSDHVFVAGKVINLYLTSESGAAALIVAAKFMGLLVDA